MNEKTKPISASDAYAGTGSNEELWPILASHGAVTDPNDIRDSYLATVPINWRNAACKDVADRYQDAKTRAEEAEADVERLRAHLEVSFGASEALCENANNLDSKVRRLRAQLAEATALLGHFVDHEDQPCELNHHGACKAHGGSELRPCDVAVGRELLGRLRGGGKAR